MRVASSAVLPHNLEDFVRILFRQAEALLREDRADVVEVRRHEVDDLHRVEGRHHRDLHELLHDREDLLGRDAREEGRVRERILLLWIQLAPDGLLLLQDDLQFGKGHVRLFHGPSYARLRCSGRTIACLIRPPNRTSTTKAAPRRSTTVPVIPWNRW